MIDQILEFIAEQEDFYYDEAFKLLDKGDLLSNALLIAQATTCWVFY